MSRDRGGKTLTAEDIVDADIVNTIVLQADQNAGSANQYLRKDSDNNLVYSDLFIPDNSITTAKIADNQVTTAKIPADAITGDKLANDIAINTSGVITSSAGFSASGSATIGTNSGNIGTTSGDIISGGNISGGDITASGLLTSSSILTGGISGTGNYTTTGGNITTTNGDIETTNGAFRGVLVTGQIEHKAGSNTINFSNDTNLVLGDASAGGGINIQGTGNLTMLSGNIGTSGNITGGILTGTSVVNSGNYTTTSGNITTTSGNITTTSGGIVTTNGDITAGTGSIRGNIVTDTISTNTGNLTLPNSNNLVLGDSGGSGGIAISGTGNLTMLSGNIGTSGNITGGVLTGTSVVNSGNFTTTNGAIQTTNGNIVSINGNIQATNGTVLTDKIQPVTGAVLLIPNNIALNLGDAAGSGSINIAGGGSITLGTGSYTTTSGEVKTTILNTPTGSGAVAVSSDLSIDSSKELKTNTISQVSGTTTTIHNNLDINSNLILGASQTGSGAVSKLELSKNSPNGIGQIRAGGTTRGDEGMVFFVDGLVAIDTSKMPTSDPGVAGQLWNDSGTVKIS